MENYKEWRMEHLSKSCYNEYKMTTGRSLCKEVSFILACIVVQHNTALCISIIHERVVINYIMIHNMKSSMLFFSYTRAYTVYRESSIVLHTTTSICSSISFMSTSSLNFTNLTLSSSSSLVLRTLPYMGKLNWLSKRLALLSFNLVER